MKKLACMVMIAACFLTAAAQKKSVPAQGRTQKQNVPAQPGEYGKPKITEAQFPCSVPGADVPMFFGVKLEMPVADARKLFPGAKKRSFGDSEYAYLMAKNAGVTTVAQRQLPKSDIGLAVESFEFSNTFTTRVESVSITFARTQKLSPEKMFERIAALTGLPAELWHVIDHAGGGHVSWRAQCKDFSIQFDAQRALFYRLSIAKEASIFEEQKRSGPSNNDGE